MKIRTLLAIICTACFCPAAENFETIPSIPERAKEHKNINDLIPKDSILRIISLLSLDSTEPLFEQSVVLTSKNYRKEPSQVIPSLYKSNKEFGSKFNIGDIMTNDILVITKDKIWRIQVYENSNFALPIACLVTDGLARYDFMLPFIKNQ